MSVNQLTSLGGGGGAAEDNDDDEQRDQTSDPGGRDPVPEHTDIDDQGKTIATTASNPSSKGTSASSPTQSSSSQTQPDTELDKFDVSPGKGLLEDEVLSVSNTGGSGEDAEVSATVHNVSEDRAPDGPSTTDSSDSGGDGPQTLTRIVERGTPNVGGGGMQIMPFPMGGQQGGDSFMDTLTSPAGLLVSALAVGALVYFGTNDGDS